MVPSWLEPSVFQFDINRLSITNIIVWIAGLKELYRLALVLVATIIPIIITNKTTKLMRGHLWQVFDFRLLGVLPRLRVVVPV